MTDKKWYKSKTMWVNILTVAGGITTAIAGHVASGGVITALGLVNVVLRYLTANPIVLE